MAMPRRIPVEFGDVFEHGLFMVGEVEPARDYDKSSKDRVVQAVDGETGLPVWTVDVIDADPAATKATRSLSVRVLGRVQPVPADAAAVGPFRPVAFEGLTATPYVDDKGGFARIAWSFRASGFAPVTRGARPASKPAA
jgi:hypothetical protein